MNIETRSVSLMTFSVTIQALHVNGKQMTLSVFRQLPVKDAFLENGELSDLNFWGIVRYEIKSEYSSGLWVVADKDGILYRCDSIPRLNFSEYSINRDIAKEQKSKNPDADLIAELNYTLAQLNKMKEGIASLSQLPQLFIAI